MRAHRRLHALALSVLLATPLIPPAAAQTPVGSAFTYQGRLTDGGAPADGSFDFQFLLFDAPAGGTQVGTTLDRPAVLVSAGLFTLSLDFGTAASGADARFLEVHVRPAGAGAYTPLSGRQRLTPAPNASYAVASQSAATAAAAPWSGLTGMPAGFADGEDADSGGDVTSVVAGTGLTGGGTAGALTLSANLSAPGGSNGTSTAQARADHVHFGQTWTGTGTGLAIASSDTGVRGESSSNSGKGVHGIARAFTAPTGSAFGVYGESQASSGAAVFGIASVAGLNFGVWGINFASGGIGIQGAGGAAGASRGVQGISGSPQGTGVLGEASSSTGFVVGVMGRTFSPNAWAIEGVATGTGGPSIGVVGVSASTAGRGVYGESATGVVGRTGSSGGTGVEGTAIAPSGNSVGVLGTSLSTGTVSVGVLGQGFTGVRGSGGAASGYGVEGYGNTGVYGLGLGSGATAVYGYVQPTGGGYAVVGENTSPTGYAGWFSGRTHVNGTLSKAAGSFRIDHPLDPERKYLSHSFVESPDMKNLYDGLVTTDGDGFATVVLPDWFQALNRDFRYQLTVVDGGEGFVLAKVARELAANRFVVRTSRGHVKVSWQVTGIRHDAYAEAHRIPVEEAKPADEAGTYLHPREHGQPDARGLAPRTPAGRREVPPARSVSEPLQPRE